MTFVWFRKWKKILVFFCFSVPRDGAAAVLEQSDLRIGPRQQGQQRVRQRGFHRLDADGGAADLPETLSNFAKRKVAERKLHVGDSI